MTLKVYLATILCLQICGFQGVEIYPCKDSKVTVFDDSPANFTCTDVPSSVRVRWGLDDASNSYIEIGGCENNGVCKVLHENQVYNFSRSAGGTESHMIIWSDLRNFDNRSVVCGVENSDTGRKRCSLIIKSHPVLDMDACSLSVVNGTVTSSCSVKHGYSSDGHYKCIWKRNGIQQNMDTPTEIKACMKNGLRHSCWSCSFTQPVPPERGIYTYSISTDPSPVQEYSRSVYIGEPHRASTGLSDGVITAGIVSPAIKIIVVVTAVIVLTIRKSNRGNPDNSDEEDRDSTKRRPSVTAYVSCSCFQARRQMSNSSFGNGAGRT